jgi:hypothetical protein
VTDAMNSDARQALELARTAQARFETIEAAAAKHELDPDRIAACSEALLTGIHAGPHQENVMWVLETATAMLTAVMAVGGEPVPVSERVDPAAFGMAVLRDLQTAAGQKGLDWATLELAAAEGLKQADADGYTHLETFWALSRATASCELGWARSLAENDDSAGA